MGRRAVQNGQVSSRRRGSSLVIGSWNVRHFDGGRARLPESFHYSAEIIDHFDIVALQEVKSLAAMDRLIALLGGQWRYFVNDSSGAGRGNHERMAFLYNTRRVQFRSLIGELVLPKGALPGDEQIGRTPFFAAFQADWFRFTLCNAHIVFKEQAGRPLREDEIRVIATEMAKRSQAEDEVHIFLGDMNIEARGDAGMRALTDNGFDVPDIGPTSLTGTKHYDQIAFAGPASESHRLSAGVVRWQEAVFREDEHPAYEAVARAMRTGADAGKAYDDWPSYFRRWRTDEMSDHLPVWIELEVDYSNTYLARIARGEA